MDHDDIIDDADLVGLDRPSNPRAVPSAAGSSKQNGETTKKVQQPKPQVLAGRQSASAILVNARQKGNPVLNNIRSVGWEYSDIPADFVLGATTCALFLSLKYHRLHPEYIYSRIKALSGRYNLRIILTMVDIDNHEAPLKELSKTSLINNVTIILAWSPQEAGHYLESYKNFEHAAPTSIKGVQSSTYSDQLVDFVTMPRGINKTDAVSLVSNFGSIRTAINARPEEISLIQGWGQKKVERWYRSVHEPFRVHRAGRRGMLRENSTMTPALSRNSTGAEGSATPALSRGVSRAEVQRDAQRDAQIAARLGIGEPLPLETAPAYGNVADADKRSDTRITDDFYSWEPGAEEEEALALAQAMTPIAQNSAPIPAQKPNGSAPSSGTKRKPADDDHLADGVAAALAKLRKT